MDWDLTRHPGDATKNGVATFADVIHDWRGTSLVCKFDITDVILPSDAEISCESFQGIFSMHVPCICCIQKSGENKCLVCPDLDEQ